MTPAGVVTTLAGLARTEGSTDGTGTEALFNHPDGVVVDGARNVYVADRNNDTLRKITVPNKVTWPIPALASSSSGLRALTQLEENRRSHIFQR